MTEPPVFAVILNWNGVVDTVECIESLQKVNYSNLKILIVDNGSTGDDVKILRNKFGQSVQIIENKVNRGFTIGCNIGITYALRNGADYVLLLNNDTIVDPDFLTHLVNIAEKEKEIGILGPMIMYYDKPGIIDSLGAKLNYWIGTFRVLGKGAKDCGQFDEIQDVDFVGGAAMLIKKKVFDEIGFLYPPFFANWEETDFCVRARRHGFRIIAVPHAKIWHKVARSLSLYDERRAYLILRNAILFMRRNASTPTFISFIFFHLFIRAPFFSMEIPFGQKMKRVFLKRVFYVVPRAIIDGFRLPKVNSEVEYPPPSLANLRTT